MNNKWVVMNQETEAKILNLMARDDILRIDIEGKDIQNKKAFMESIEEILQFPSKCEGKFSRFDDWIRDLSWLPSDKGICIQIKNYQEFMMNDIRNKDKIEKIFQQDVLPFWECDVVKTVKGGKPREFYVVVIP